MSNLVLTKKKLFHFIKAFLQEALYNVYMLILTVEFGREHLA
jgi:hypothetical protein